MLNITLEFDEVTIASDLNDMVADITNDIRTNTDKVLSTTEKNELNLYYVACSRAKKVLNNAILLEPWGQLELDLG